MPAIIGTTISDDSEVIVEVTEYNLAIHKDRPLVMQYQVTGAREDRDEQGTPIFVIETVPFHEGEQT